jgi:hypothetical protein
MEDDALAAGTRPYRDVDHVENHREVRVVANGVRYHFAVVELDGRRQVRLGPEEAELRHVRDPFLVVARGTEVTAKEIRGHGPDLALVGPVLAHPDL